MKQTISLTFLFISVYIIQAQETAFDRFFTKHPFDLQMGTHLSSYKFTNINTNEQETGLTGNISGGIGWRYSLVRSDYFSFGPRIGVEVGYFSQDENNNLTLHTPFTLDISIGAGSTKASNAILGVSFGGGYAANTHNYTIVKDEVKYTVGKGYLAPIVYCNINFKVDDTIFGFKPAVSWNNDYTFVGLSLIGYLTFKD
jgi:hypothetical protein